MIELPKFGDILMKIDGTWKALFNPGAASDYFKSVRFPAFNPDTDGYSPANAIWLSELSRLIYRKEKDEIGHAAQPPSRNDILKKVSLREHRFFNRPGVQCAIVISENTRGKAFAVLVFRGTKGTLANWMINFESVLSPWPSGGSVHRGFKRLFFDIWERVEKELSSIDLPVFYTGHSLGAALATLAASLRPPRALYSFGSPRVGDIGFVSSLYNTPIYRIANGNDIVTGMPPATAFGYCHAGENPDVSPNHRSIELSRRLFGSSVNSFFEKSKSRIRSFPRPPAFLMFHAPANYTTLLAGE